MSSSESAHTATAHPLARALLDHFGRPAALSDNEGNLVAMNASFRRQSEQLGSDRGVLRLERGRLCDGTGRPLPLGVVATTLTPDLALTDGWHLVELASRTISLPAMAERFDQLAGQGATLLKLELRKQGGLLNRLAVNQIKAIVDGLEERLLTCLPEGSAICRNRVDRLIALIPGHRSLPDLRREAETWQRTLSMPMLFGDDALTPVLSLGLSRAPQDGLRFELLLDSSDQALARAHRQPTASAFVAAPPERSQRQLRLLAAPLATAIDQEKLRLAYQPIVELASRRIEGVEVLCRWDDPILGRISPTDFIAVAEATEQINLLGSWLIDTVFAQLRRWLAMPLGLHYVSLNVSPLQLHHEGLVEVLQSGLERHGLNPAQIMLEITEDQTLVPRSRARAHLLQLQRMGFTLAMDDYGTGYSGLQRLQSLPFGAVKVDRCLIKAIETDRLQQAMLRGVVDLQNNTNLRVVVEGVERETQRSTLLDLGCQLGQGFLFSRPIRADQLESLLRAA